MTSRAFWLAAGVLLVMALAGLFLFQGEWIALALPLVRSVSPSSCSRLMALTPSRSSWSL